VACELAQCIPLVGHGSTELTPAEEAERRKYGDLALEALREAVAKGHRDVDALEKAEGLAALRGRDEYKELVRALRKRPEIEALRSPVLERKPGP
jgi:hypothetical protein